jgi:hypothetical protein
MTREKAIEWIKYHINITPYEDTDELKIALEMAIKALNQEPKRGKWLAIRTKDGTHEITCSCCRYVRSELLNHHISEESLRRYIKDITAEYKYCHNCGAKMEDGVRE